MLFERLPTSPFRVYGVPHVRAYEAKQEGPVFCCPRGSVLGRSSVCLSPGFSPAKITRWGNETKMSFAAHKIWPRRASPPPVDKSQSIAWRAWGWGRTATTTTTTTATTTTLEVKTRDKRQDVNDDADDDAESSERNREGTVQVGRKQRQAFRAQNLPFASFRDEPRRGPSHCD
jgi:hypothetical protein